MNAYPLTARILGQSTLPGALTLRLRHATTASALASLTMKAAEIMMGTLVPAEAALLEYKVGRVVENGTDCRLLGRPVTG